MNCWKRSFLDDKWVFFMEAHTSVVAQHPNLLYKRGKARKWGPTSRHVIDYDSSTVEIHCRRVQLGIFSCHNSHCRHVWRRWRRRNWSLRWGWSWMGAVTWLTCWGYIGRWCRRLRVHAKSLVPTWWLRGRRRLRGWKRGRSHNICLGMPFPRLSSSQCVIIDICIMVDKMMRPTQLMGAIMVVWVIFSSVWAM